MVYMRNTLGLFLFGNGIITEETSVPGKTSSHTAFLDTQINRQPNQTFMMAQ